MLVYLQAIGSGPEKSKFERIFALYQGRMYHTAYQILRNRQDAEDAVHQALLAIAKNISKSSDPECTKTLSYIVTITENKAIDMYRSRRRRSAPPLDETMGIPCPMPDGAVARAIVDLPARYRQLILLKYAEGYTNDELAAMLGLSCSGVCSLDQRAKQKLRELLKEEGIDI